MVSKIIRNIGKNDMRLIRRDLILITLLIFVVYIAVVLRFLLPWANRYLADKGFLPNAGIAHDLSYYYPIIIAFLLIYTGGMLAGAILGFLALSEKDDRTVMAMLVTPVSPKQFMTYRIVVTAIISFLIIMFQFYVVGIHVLTLWKMVLIALGGSLLGPIIMLFLAGFADGKLQGMGYGKFLSLGGLVIILSWFVKEPLQYVFGIFPPYWISKAYWLALDGHTMWLLALFVGILLQLGMIKLLMMKCEKNMYSNA